MRCPMCHEEAEGRVCTHCGHNLEAAYAMAKASGRFYNEGLRYARKEQYQHARIWLKKAIRYNRENLQARNLLGLVYMQTGEIGEAVGQWTQSAVICEDAAVNPAVEYLKKASRALGKAAQLKQAVRLYNEGLALLQDGQRDTALLHLKKAVSLSDRYVRARELLALCWIDEHQFDKAEMLLQEAEAIDPEDPQLPRLKSLFAEEGERWRGSKEGKEAARNSVEPVEAESLSMPIFAGKTPKRSIRTYLRQNASVVQFLLFALGLVVGLMFMALLVTPEQLSALRRESNELSAQLAQMESAQEEKTDQIAALQEEAALMTEEHGVLESEYNLYQENTTALLTAWSLYQSEDLANARESLNRVQTGNLSAEQRELYEWLDAQIGNTAVTEDSSEVTP
ncbi:MAG: tetratricopeptide repeat protein [Lachnospirales bacterium]